MSFCEKAQKAKFVAMHYILPEALLTLYRMVMPIGTPFLKEKINN